VALYRREYQLIKANPKASTYLACGVLVRGDMQVSDINRNIKRMQSGLQMAHWNQEGFKVCAAP
jgi:tubulin epsilon